MNLSILILSKISNMSKIGVLIYRIDIYNLDTKIAPFPDQEKFLKVVVFSIVVSMNANTKNHCDIKTQLAQFPDHKKHLENNQELSFIFQNMLL